MTISVRDAQRQDAADIANIHVEAWRNAYAGILPNDYLASMRLLDRVRYWQTVLDHQPNLFVKVACKQENATAVGFAGYGITRNKEPKQDSKKTAEIYTLYVAPEHQDQSVGRHLFDVTTDDMSRKGFSLAHLWVLASNPARYFYEHLGGHLADEKMQTVAGTEQRILNYCWTLP